MVRLAPSRASVTASPRNSRTPPTAMACASCSGSASSAAATANLPSGAEKSARAEKNR